MRDYDGSAVLEAIRAVQATQAVDETIAVLSGFIESYGFERIFLGQLVNPANVPLREILYVSDWPDELKEHRRSQMAILHDPIAICALRSKRPFSWAEAREYASRVGKMVVDMVHDYGITDGIMFPMHALHSVSGGVSLGVVVTDKCPSYRAAMKVIGSERCQETGRHLNNRAENSHLPFRRRERAMSRFRRMRSLQKFASIHSSVYNHFNHQRNIESRARFKSLRDAALLEWRELIAA